MIAAKKKKASREEIIYHMIAYPVFGLITFICAYPFYYLLLCTISDNKLVDLGRIVLLPKGIHFDNYIKIFKTNNLWNAVMISLLRVIIGTGIQILVSSYMAYFFTKQEMWKRKIWYRFVVATMYFSAGMIPIYLNWRMLGLVNTFWIYVIPSMLSAYNMILSRPL